MDDLIDFGTPILGHLQKTIEIQSRQRVHVFVHFCWYAMYDLLESHA
jgi:hypothetical protein